MGKYKLYFTNNWNNNNNYVWNNSNHGIDIKKIIALSTLSQLGIIIIILGLGNPILSFFHLISHAFFKAILFICAGIIIHNIKDYQDIRKIGFSFNNLNYSISIIIIANLSLCGLPFIRGLYSKDLIIEIIIIKGKKFNYFFFLIIGTILTVLYSCRLNLLISINFLKIERFYFISENSIFILIRIFILLPFSIIGGIILSFNIIRSNKIIFMQNGIKIILFDLIILNESIIPPIIEKGNKINILINKFNRQEYKTVNIVPIIKKKKIIKFFPFIIIISVIKSKSYFTNILVVFYIMNNYSCTYK